MELITLTIFERGNNYRKGTLHYNGELLGYTLERADAFIHKVDKVVEIEWMKSKVKCAIPYGTYTVKNGYSPKFKMTMPHVLDVPGFEGILIHPGNEPRDTEGCILIGENHETGKGWITNSAVTLIKFREKMSKQLDEGLVLLITDIKDEIV